MSLSSWNSSHDFHHHVDANMLDRPKPALYIPRPLGVDGQLIDVDMITVRFRALRHYTFHTVAHKDLVMTQTARWDV